MIKNLTEVNEFHRKCSQTLTDNSKNEFLYNSLAYFTRVMKRRRRNKENVDFKVTLNCRV